MATSFSPAGMALFGGGATSLMDGLSLGDQVGQETEEERRKRLAAQQAARSSGGDTRPGGLGGFGAALSPAGVGLGF